MKGYQKPKIIKRPAYYRYSTILENQYSSNLYNSEVSLIRLYAYLPLIFSLKHIKLSKYHRVLDLGCADGPFLPTLHYFSNCSIATDINEELIMESMYLTRKKLNSSKAIHILQSDGHNLPFREEFFDIVFGPHHCH